MSHLRCSSLYKVFIFSLRFPHEVRCGKIGFWVQAQAYLAVVDLNPEIEKLNLGLDPKAIIYQWGV